MSVDKKINYQIQGGVKNYRPSKMVTVPKIAKSSPDTPTAKLAYITPEEQDVLIDLNLYGSLKGKPNRGPGGIPSLEGDFGGPDGFGGYQGGGDYSSAETGNTLNIDASNRHKLKSKLQTEFDENFDGEKENNYNILITTEVLAEGINLHRSNIIINYDISYYYYFNIIYNY